MRAINFTSYGYLRPGLDTGLAMVPGPAPAAVGTGRARALPGRGSSSGSRAGGPAHAAGRARDHAS